MRGKVSSAPHVAVQSVRVQCPQARREGNKQCCGLGTACEDACEQCSERQEAVREQEGERGRRGEDHRERACRDGYEPEEDGKVLTPGDLHEHTRELGGQKENEVRGRTRATTAVGRVDERLEWSVFG